MDSTLMARRNGTWVLEWNQENRVGDPVEWTDDSAKTWTASTLASPAFLRGGEPVVRVRGARRPVHLKDVAPVT
ncbi:hypothetical protein LCGC14_1004160 [marine sediment metagenome]|uniref:Uncharacterized protein n=1 Tax=marine sediment metagenome TaxID=412755 RepID=A0A0F9N6R8_9ZZZZ